MVRRLRSDLVEAHRLDGRNMVRRYFEPALRKAGYRASASMTFGTRSRAC
ncbi:MAG TPA: hypothetical protein VFL41_04920 [Gaiellaceae bacterium]|nr:hypothetical protein [Gaiellaceae bacterium]